MIRLTDKEWERIIFPEERLCDGRSRLRLTPTRRVFEAELVDSRAHSSIRNHKSVYRRFQIWCRREVLRRVLSDVASELRDKGALMKKCFIRCDVPHGERLQAEIGPTSSRP
jgi:hypothetical protein